MHYIPILVRLMPSDCEQNRPGKLPLPKNRLRPSSASSHIRAGPDGYYRRIYGEWSRFGK